MHSCGGGGLRSRVSGAESAAASLLIQRSGAGDTRARVPPAAVDEQHAPQQPPSQARSPLAALAIGPVLQGGGGLRREHDRRAEKGPGQAVTLSRCPAGTRLAAVGALRPACGARLDANGGWGPQAAGRPPL